MDDERSRARKKGDSVFAPPDKADAAEQKSPDPAGHTPPRGASLPEAPSPTDLPLAHDNLLHLQRANGNMIRS